MPRLDEASQMSCFPSFTFLNEIGNLVYVQYQCLRHVEADEMNTYGSWSCVLCSHEDGARPGQVNIRSRRFGVGHHTKPASLYFFSTVAIRVS